MPARRLLIHSMMNLRELGGYTARNGRVTQYGRFLRGDAPVSLTEADIAVLLEYGVRHVIDLRTVQEATERPCVLAAVPGIEYHNIPFLKEVAMNGMSFRPKEHYVMNLSGPNRVGEAMRAMANAGDGAILFHCTAGKDRTGMLAALLMMLVDIPKEDIKADYQVSFTYLQRLLGMILEMGGTEEMCRSDAEWLDPVFAFIEERGGVEAYLTALGVQADELERLRAKLLS